MSRPKRIITPQELHKICKDYLSGISINTLQKETKLQKHQLKKLLNDEGIQVLSAYQTKVKNAKPIDITCLDANSPLSSYVLGCIFGDGHVGYDEHKYKYSVSLISTDYDIIISAQALFGKDFSIHTILPKKKKKKITYNIVVNSKEFSKFLREKYGFVNRKSNCLVWPQLETDMYSFFVSGLLSTDGCVRTDIRRKNQACSIEFSYSSNCLAFVEKLRLYLSNTLKLEEVGHIKTLKANKKRKNPNYSLRYTGSSANKILSWIYNPTDELTRCKRKYEIYQNYITCVSNSMI